MQPLTRDPENRAELDGCAGKHPAPRLTGALDLEWLPVHHSFDPARMLESTCHRCRAVVYELVDIGGAFAVRRTDTATGRLQETARVQKFLAITWWQRVISGAAR